eukprot:6186068-Pleurochrysis_carterae.AAC.3
MKSANCASLTLCMLHALDCFRRLNACETRVSDRAGARVLLSAPRDGGAVRERHHDDAAESAPKHLWAARERRHYVRPERDQRALRDHDVAAAKGGGRRRAEQGGCHRGGGTRVAERRSQGAAIMHHKLFREEREEKLRRDSTGLRMVPEKYLKRIRRRRRVAAETKRVPAARALRPFPLAEISVAYPLLYEESMNVRCTPRPPEHRVGVRFRVLGDAPSLKWPTNCCIAS